jgi:hypothetical protein
MPGHGQTGTDSPTSVLVVRNGHIMDSRYLPEPVVGPLLRLLRVEPFHTIQILAQALLFLVVLYLLFYFWYVYQLLEDVHPEALDRLTKRHPDLKHRFWGLSLMLLICGLGFGFTILAEVGGRMEIARQEFSREMDLRYRRTADGAMKLEDPNHATVARPNAGGEP